MEFAASAAEAASALQGRRYVDAEFMYKPRPVGGREQAVFDYTFNSRLAQLELHDAILLICNSQQTIDSLAEFGSFYPDLRIVAAIVNPSLWKGEPTATPHQLGWDDPEKWQQYNMTDRWARIDFALAVGELLDSPGYLIMPAHDAVWGQGLLERLSRFSHQYARGGLPAAVSPYTYYQHSSVQGADIPQDIIDLMNIALNRDVLLPWKVRLNRVQAFWGKMGIMPFKLCGAVRDAVEMSVWEDDLEIDGTIRRLDYGLRCLWVSNPTLYRQFPPVFERHDLRTVIERTLHYSLNIPGGRSSLNIPLGPLGHIRRWISPRFAQLNSDAEGLIAECDHAIQERLGRFGASWVDWGAYRYVIRVGDPAVEVWKRENILV